MNRVLSPDEIKQVLFAATITTPDKTDGECRYHYTTPPQEGPLRHYDRTMTCASRRCGSPTHYKLQGTPYCSVHLVRKMNEMLVSFGVSR